MRNIPAAVNGSAFAIFHNQGQACIAGSRLLLHEKIADEFLEKFLALAKSIKLGNPLDPSTEMGPLTSAGHRDRVLSYVEVAKQQGGRILTGGKAPSDPALAAGCYVEPTVVEAKADDRVCQEEVFGPFVTRDPIQGRSGGASRSPTATTYGLGGGLWTRNLQRGAPRGGRDSRRHGVDQQLQARAPGSPFGGVGESGYGREMGFEAMHEYTDAKSVWVNVDAQIPPFYKR